MIEGYQITECVYEGANSSVYSGICEKSEVAVTIKILKEEYLSFVQIDRIVEEYKFEKCLNFPEIIKHIDLLRLEGAIALISENFGGMSLKHYIEKKIPDIDIFLKIALALCDIVGKLHHKNITHKDIKPQNILIIPSTHVIKLGGLGISSFFKAFHENTQYFPDAFLYMSPEQTGRTNHVLDYRSDFYSMGITFYEMLTGRVPFDSDDPIEIIFAHKSQKPLAPHKETPHIPKMLSDIIMKLLEKDPSLRYQSAYGLKKIL